MGIFSSNTGSSASPESYNVPRPITASASRVNLDKSADAEKLATRKKRVKWQSDAYDYYDRIGEISFSANTIANVASRINIFTGYVSDSSRVPSKLSEIEGIDSEHVKLASDILALLETGDGGTPDLLRLIALNLFVTGECYLVKMPGNAFMKTPEKWEIHSVDEVVTEGSGSNIEVYIKSSPDEEKKFWTKIPKNGFICRMWRKHPRYSQEADSSLRAILDDCDDLLLYTAEARAVSKSRIAAGLLFIPDGIADSSVEDSDAEDDPDATDEYDITEDITDALVSPIGDDANVYSVAPLVIRGADDLGEKINYISFNRPTDPMYQSNIEFKLERILSALDIPKDIAKGLSNVKYSNGSLVEETLYSSHIEPLILAICDMVTTGFLRPALLANGVPPEVANKIVVWYDPSAVLIKSNKSDSANFGIENDLVSDSAWRAANGFTEFDAPNEEQYARKILTSKLVLSDPALTSNLLELVLPELMKSSRDTSLANSDPNSSSALDEALGQVVDGSDPNATPATAPEQPTSGLIE